MRDQTLLLFDDEEFKKPEERSEQKSDVKQNAAKPEDETSEIEKAGAPKKKVGRPKKPGPPEVLRDDWEADKQYYIISEVAKLFQLNTSHIRFWTKEFDLKVKLTGKGDRLYSPENIIELRDIYKLMKQEGFTIAGARAKLKESLLSPTDKQHFLSNLERLKHQLQELRQQL